MCYRNYRNHWYNRNNRYHRDYWYNWYYRYNIHEFSSIIKRHHGDHWYYRYRASMLNLLNFIRNHGNNWHNWYLLVFTYRVSEFFRYNWHYRNYRNNWY